MREEGKERRRRVGRGRNQSFSLNLFTTFARIWWTRRISRPARARPLLSRNSCFTPTCTRTHTTIITPPRRDQLLSRLAPGSRVSSERAFRSSSVVQMSSYLFPLPPHTPTQRCLRGGRGVRGRLAHARRGATKIDSSLLFPPVALLPDSLIFLWDWKQVRPLEGCKTGSTSPSCNTARTRPRVDLYICRHEIWHIPLWPTVSRFELTVSLNYQIFFST